MKGRKVEAKLSTMLPMMMLWLWTMEAGLSAVADSRPDLTHLVDDYKKMRPNVVREVAELRVGMDLGMTTCIGYKGPMS